MIIQVLDLSVEEDDFEDKEEYRDNAFSFFKSYEEFREFARNMLNGYYELRSKYGNPINDMIDYISNESLVELVTKYSYEINIVL